MRVTGMGPRLIHANRDSLREGRRNEMGTDGGPPLLGFFVLAPQHPKPRKKSRVWHDAAETSDEIAHMGRIAGAAEA